MQLRKVTIRFKIWQQAWADQKKMDAVNDFRGLADIKHKKPDSWDGWHFYYITEKSNK